MDYSNLFKAITKLYEQKKEPELISAPPTFPFPSMYPGQKQTIDSLAGFKEAALTSHTGAGKSACFLTLTRGIPTLVIEPRKFLQLQLSKGYFQDYVLFGKSEYYCPHSNSHRASTAPCNSKISCETTNYHDSCTDSCTKSSQTCLNHPCRVFTTDNGYHKYPCEGCVYIAAVQQAMRVLKDKGTVICNFGNFWNLMQHAEVVVIDEADLFFREISSPTKMHYSKSKDHSEDSVQVLLKREKEGLEKALKTSDSRSTYGIQNMLYTIAFLAKHADLCFKYQKKDKIYVEVSLTVVSGIRCWKCYPV